MEPDLNLYELYKAQHNDLETAAENARLMHLYGRSAGHGDRDHEARRSIIGDRALVGGATATALIYAVLAGW